MLGSEENQSFGKGEGVEARGAAPTRRSSSSGWQPSQECDSKGVVAASHLKVLGREEWDPAQDFLPHRLEC